MANGDIRLYHYAYVGGPLIWCSDYNFSTNSVEYYSAYAEAHFAADANKSTNKSNDGRLETERARELDEFFAH